MKRDERSSCFVEGNHEGISPASALGENPKGKPKTASTPISASKHVFLLFLSLSASNLILSLKLFIHIYHLAQLASQFLQQLMRNGSAEFGMGPHVAYLFESETAFTGPITAEVSIQSFFPATSAKRFCSRQHLLLHAASTHAQHRCTHIHTQPQYPLPLFWCTT